LLSVKDGIRIHNTDREIKRGIIGGLLLDRLGPRASTEMRIHGREKGAFLLLVVVAIGWGHCWRMMIIKGNILVIHQTSLSLLVSRIPARMVGGAKDAMRCTI
jgi:hypothetical protein